LGEREERETWKEVNECAPDCSVVVKDLRLKDENKDNDLMSKDEDLKIGP